MNALSNCQLPRVKTSGQISGNPLEDVQHRAHGIIAEDECSDLVKLPLKLALDMTQASASHRPNSANVVRRLLKSKIADQYFCPACWDELEHERLVDSERDKLTGLTFAVNEEDDSSSSLSKTTAAMLSTSSFPPLSSFDAIRLVELQPGVVDANLKCKIVQTSLSDAPYYEAMSYTWGAAEGEKPLTCHVDGSDLYVRVTRNCISMLRRLRSQDTSRLLWIDAICIDQGNIPERNMEVAMMGKIYERASRVIVDLGQSSDMTEGALHALKACSETKLYEMEYGLSFRDNVSHLYRSSWFSRVWVLQETLWAKDAVALVGMDLYPWSIFRPFSIWVDSGPAQETEPWHVALPSVVPHALEVKNHRSHQYLSKRDLLSLLCKGRTCNATDPRDKVFALLPMLTDASTEGLRADYAKNTVQVFTEVAVYLFSAFGLSFLPCIGYGSHIADLPSWVPDWSTHMHEPLMIDRPGSPFSPLSACATYTKPTARTLSHNLFKVRGIIVDVILTTTQSLNVNIRTNHHYDKDNASKLSPFLERCRPYSGNLRPTDSSQTTVRLSIWEPRTSESRIHPPQWMYMYGLPFANVDQLSDNEVADLCNYFCEARELVLTKTHGYFGVVPKESVEGDVVVCFLGARVPYILRPLGGGEWRGLEDGGQRYQILGEAYVYGIMDGEGMAGFQGDQDGSDGDGEGPGTNGVDFVIE